VNAAHIPAALWPLLRRVEKPGRYVGGEFGAEVRPDAALRTVVSYPDLYEIGMSNAAIRILYSLLNSLPDVSCERVFAPAPDFEAVLREAGMPLFSLETARPLSEFDVVCFSIGYELTLTNLCAILETGGVGLLREARGPREPIVIAGGPATTNPVPLGVFVDAVFIGEAEGWAETAFSRMAQMKKAGAERDALLGYLHGQPSVWFPRKAETTRRALWRGFAGTAADAAFPVPSMRVVQDHGTVEIMRGCPNACRFCQATILYRACRPKREDVIRAEIDTLVHRAGYRQITLSSLSSGDFRGIHSLVKGLNSLYSSEQVSFSLPSLRVDSLSLELLKEISEVRKSGLTFAVETARPEWQAEVRKTVTLEKTVEILREARAQGWKAAKFYFMVGLPPTIDQEETAPIVEFLQAVRSATGMTITVNVAGFIPKPHTPWERAAQIGEELALSRIMAVKNGLAGNGFKVGYHAPILSLLEGIVARGDERAGLLVVDAYRRGARLDAWEEHVNLDIWRKVITEAGWDVLGETCRARGRDEKLPWDSVALGMSASVVADAPDAAEAQPPQAVHTLVSAQQGPQPAPSAPPDVAPTGAPPAASAPLKAPPDVTPVAASPSPPTVAAPWQRVVFSFTKTGAAAFISHLDLMTVFERALLRAGFSARFTEGFNPKPRLEFANPLSLGLESDEEIAAVDLHDFDGAEAFVDRMNAGLPGGLRVRRAAVAHHEGPARRRSLMSLYWGGDFEVSSEQAPGRTIRLPASGLSIRKTLEDEGTWAAVRARRLATWAASPSGEPVSYFEALGAAGPAASPALT
jgi:radical SAM superfamily enzyme YgiQ (UPF0313 family)